MDRSSERHSCNAATQQTLEEGLGVSDRLLELLDGINELERLPKILSLERRRQLHMQLHTLHHSQEARAQVH